MKITATKRRPVGSQAHLYVAFLASTLALSLLWTGLIVFSDAGRAGCPTNGAVSAPGYDPRILLGGEGITAVEKKGEGAAPATAIETNTNADGGSMGCHRPNRYPWPSSASSRLGDPLVQIGCSFVTDARRLLLSELDEYLRMYKNRPTKQNSCGMRVNHSYALWVTVRALQPETIIESGVNAGQSTYFFRTAAPNARIVAIDPKDTPICRQRKRWIDEKNATYYTGQDFKDFQDIDWGGMIKRGELDPTKTLVFLDDHTWAFRRFSTLMRHGFRHVILEDNYRAGEGDTPADKTGWCMKQMLARVDADSEFLFRNLASYAEFPPLVPPSMAKDYRGIKKPKYLHPNDTCADIEEPILRPDVEGNEEDIKLYKRITDELGIDRRLTQTQSFLELMMYQQLAYFEVRPLAPHLAEAKNWK